MSQNPMELLAEHQERIRKLEADLRAILTADGTVRATSVASLPIHGHSGASQGGPLRKALVADYLQFLEQGSSPGVPPSGASRLFADGDGDMTQKDDAGSEADLSAGGGSSLTVQEEDGAPIDTAVTVIRVPNGGLVDNGAGDVSLGYAASNHPLADHSDDDAHTATLKLAKLEVDDANFHLDIVSSKPRMTLGATQYMEMDRTNYLLTVLDTTAGQITLDVGTPAIYLYTADGDAFGAFALDASVGGFLVGPGGASVYDLGLRRAAAGWFNITTTSGSALRDLGLRYLSMKSASGAITAMTNASAQLEMLATDKGFKPNAVTTTQRDAISSPADGLIVYNTDNDRLEVYDTTISAWAPVTQRLTMIELIIDGGGSAITTGVKADLVIPFSCVPTAWDLLADQSGSIVIDIWKDTYANYPPTVADAITGSEGKPTISSATKAQDTAWAPGAWTRGDTLRFNVDSITTVTRVTLAVWVRKT